LKKFFRVRRTPSGKKNFKYSRTRNSSFFCVRNLLPKKTRNFQSPETSKCVAVVGIKKTSPEITTIEYRSVKKVQLFKHASDLKPYFLLWHEELFPMKKVQLLQHTSDVTYFCVILLKNSFQERDKYDENILSFSKTSPGNTNIV